MPRFISILSCLFILVLLASLTVAGIPKLINYQGMLTDNSGTPLNGSYSIAFKIYNAESGGTERWEETQTGVSVTNGLFNVILGSVTPINLDFSEDYWLDITVDGETMPSRLKFTSVGYAYRAMVADTAYATTPGAGSHWSVSDSVLYTNARWGIARGGVGNVLYGADVHTHVNLGSASTTGTSGQDYSYCTAGGGFQNTASGNYATVGGGAYNTARGFSATVAGGGHNTADTNYATVGGGYYNTADTTYATVGGGYVNTASGHGATVGGGVYDTASGNYATVGGGFKNTASATYATVGGGSNNTASGNYSFAAGRRAKANHTGTSVWADYTDADFASTGDNQFLIRASGGVGIGTTSPDERLQVENSESGGRSFLQIETSYASNWGEAGIRIKTP